MVEKALRIVAAMPTSEGKSVLIILVANKVERTKQKHVALSNAHRDCLHALLPGQRAGGKASK
jgi:hypothetical protein